MIPQTVAGILLAIPLAVIAFISLPYWIKFKGNSKPGTAKQGTPYNKLFLSLVGLGYFCIWPFWIGGMVLLLLNKHHTVFAPPDLGVIYRAFHTSRWLPGFISRSDTV